jgi:uncharacterized protein with HEPN domain
MQREAKAYLWDIANAAASIRAFTDGKDLDVYLNNDMLRAAVERKFGIVGEALSQLLRNFPSYLTRSRWSAISSAFATKSFTVTQPCETISSGRSFRFISPGGTGK